MADEKKAKPDNLVDLSAARKRLRPNSAATEPPSLEQAAPWMYSDHDTIDFSKLDHLPPLPEPIGYDLEGFPIYPDPPKEPFVFRLSDEDLADIEKFTSHEGKVNPPPNDKDKPR